MDDRALMEDLLLVTKGVCDLYMHGTIAVSYTHLINSKGSSRRKVDEVLIYGRKK